MVDGRVDGPNDIRSHIRWTGQAEPNVETDFAKPQLIKGWNLTDCPRPSSRRYRQWAKLLAFEGGGHHAVVSVRRLALQETLPVVERRGSDFMESRFNLTLKATPTVVRTLG